MQFDLNPSVKYLRDLTETLKRCSNFSVISFLALRSTWRRSFTLDQWPYVVGFTFAFYLRHVLLVLAGRDKRVDRQNVHASVLMEGLFMVRNGRSGKNWTSSYRQTASRGLVEEWPGYSSSLRPCTGGKNMLPAQKNQDTFVIIRSISRGPLSDWWIVIRVKIGRMTLEVITTTLSTRRRAANGVEKFREKYEITWWDHRTIAEGYEATHLSFSNAPTSTLHDLISRCDKFSSVGYTCMR